MRDLNVKEQSVEDNILNEGSYSTHYKKSQKKSEDFVTFSRVFKFTLYGFISFFLIFFIIDICLLLIMFLILILTNNHFSNIGDTLRILNYFIQR